MRTTFYVLNDSGEPIPVASIFEWGPWWEAADRQLALAELGDGVKVSTVFLGIDHNWTGEGAPILWETLIRGGPLDGDMRRYASAAEAVAGHAEMVAEAQAAQGSS